MNTAGEGRTWAARIVRILGEGPAFSIAAAILFAAAWIPRLTRSFWVDEAGTFWMAHEGVVRALQKTWHWPGQSLLYSAIASFFCVDGTPAREILLRVPSLIGIAAAAYFVYRIAEGRIGRGSGKAAAVLFLFHPEVIEIGFQARPYALAMAAVAASCWTLCEWERSRVRKHLLQYLIASALVIYLHYFFATILIAHACYLLYVLLTERRGERFGEMAGAGAGIAILAAPLIPHFRMLIAVRHTLPYAPAPSVADLVAWIAPPTLVAGFLIAGCFLLPMLSPAKGREFTGFQFLLAVWWLLGPVIFCAVSKATDMRIFLPRYLGFALPGQSLLFAYCGWRLFDAASVRVWALASVFLFAANPLLTASKTRGPYDLLPMIRLVRAEAAAPVFFPSMLQESLFGDWKSGNREDSYLFAPLVAYPISNQVFPLPAGMTDDAREYVSSTIDVRLTRESKVLFVDINGAWHEWIVGRMKNAGFHGLVRPAGRFDVLVFSR